MSKPLRKGYDIRGRIHMEPYKGGMTTGDSYFHADCRCGWRSERVKGSFRARQVLIAHANTCDTALWDLLGDK